MKTVIQRIESLNSCRLIGSHPSGSAAWLEQRKGSIGGSDIAPVMGLSPFKSALTLYYEKAGLLPDREPTTRMMLGNYLEAGIIALWQDLNPNVTVHHQSWTFSKVDSPLFHANPDAIIEDKLGNLSILEVKHTGQYWNEIPEYYKLQVLWYQFVTGLKNPATLIAVTGGDLREFIVEWDESLMTEVIEAVKGFLGLLAMGVEPDWDGSDSTYETVRELSPGITDAQVELECGVELLAAKQIFDAADENLQKYKSKALAELNGARVGMLDGVEIVRLQQRGEGKPFLTFTKGN